MTAPSAQVGFAIVSHEGGSKLTRLIAALDREYDSPAIAIHHDFSQSRLDRQSFGPNVMLVEDWVRTGWARWGIVEGSLKAFRLLFDRTNVDWLFLLSASDYPIRSGALVRNELTASDCDAYLDVRPLDNASIPLAEMVGEANPKLNHFDAPGVRAQKRRFYCSRQFWVPVIRRKPRLRIGKWTYRPPFDGPNPFGEGLRCFYGDEWLTMNRKACSILLEPSESNLALQKHFRHRTQIDETYYATVLANASGLRICRHNRRFAEWNGGGAHPMDLTSRQLPEMLASNAFFARKFGADTALLNAIDRHLGASSRNDPASPVNLG